MWGDTKDLTLDLTPVRQGPSSWASRRKLGLHSSLILLWVRGGVTPNSAQGALPGSVPTNDP